MLEDIYTKGGFTEQRADLETVYLIRMDQVRVMQYVL